MRLFHEQGYYATTIEQIAEAAEISPSTFFRYFPTKETVVLEDDFDPVIIDMFRQQPAELNPIQALRGALRSSMALMSDTESIVARERLNLSFSVPELRAAALNQFFSTLEMFAGILAERVGRPSNDFHVLTLAGAIIGAITSALSYCSDKPDKDFFEVSDEALAHLEAGFPL